MDATQSVELTPLTKKVLEYQKGLIQVNASKNSSFKALEREVIQASYLIIYTYPVAIKVLVEEDASDFLLKLETRVPKLLKDFFFEFLSYESYLKKIIFWQSNTFIHRKRNQERHYVCALNGPEEIERYFSSTSEPCSFYQEGSWDSIVSQDEFIYCPSDTWNTERTISLQLKARMAKSHKLRSRILQLVLLCSDSLNAQQVSCIASFLSMDENELAHLIAEAIDKGYRRLQITDQVRSTRDFHFYEKLFLERELMFLISQNADPVYIERTNRRLMKERMHCSNRQKESRNRPGVVTHATVAQMLAVPKGTIDSGMQALRKIVRDLVDD